MLAPRSSPIYLDVTSTWPVALMQTRTLATLVTVPDQSTRCPPDLCGVTSLTFQALSGRPVYTSPWEHIESHDPQHISLATKADLVQFREMLVTSRDRIQTLFNEGRTEAEVLALKPLADLDKTWAMNEAQADFHTRNVYNSFKRY